MQPDRSFDADTELASVSWALLSNAESGQCDAVPARGDRAA